MDLDLSCLKIKYTGYGSSIKTFVFDVPCNTKQLAHFISKKYGCCNVKYNITNNELIIGSHISLIDLRMTIREFISLTNEAH